MPQARPCCQQPQNLQGVGLRRGKNPCRRRKVRQIWMRKVEESLLRRRLSKCSRHPLAVPPANAWRISALCPDLRRKWWDSKAAFLVDTLEMIYTISHFCSTRMFAMICPFGPAGRLELKLLAREAPMIRNSALAAREVPANSNPVQFRSCSAVGLTQGIPH